MDRSQSIYLKKFKNIMFYKCPKCDKRWQFPVPQCPDCFENLEKMVSNNIKVIGCTKVSAPSLTHPKVPFYILLLEDEHGNKWSYKSQKEYKENDIFVLDTAKTKDAVAIWSWRYDISESLEKFEYLLNGFNINEKTTILVLPRLASDKHPYLRDNTTPDFLDAILKFLASKGANSLNIMVGAQSFTDTPIELMAQKSQLLEVLQANKVQPLILNMAGFDSLYDLKISEFAKKVDLIINIPILKVEKNWASENLLYLLEKDNYLALQSKEAKNEAIKKIVEGLPNILTIAQANEVQNADGITKTTSIFLASYNPQNLDKVFADIMMSPEGAGEGIEIVGRQILDMQYRPR